MLRRRPGRAASELPRRPHARRTWAPRAPGCCRYGPARPQRAGGRVRGEPGPGSRSAPPRPHPSPGARRTRGRAGGRGGPGVPVPRRGREGAPPLSSPGGAGAGGSRPGRVGLASERALGRGGGGGEAWACAPTRAGADATRGAGAAGDSGAPSAAATPAPGAEGAHSPRGRQTFSALRANPPLGFQRWHFLGLARTPAPINPPCSAGDME